MKKMEKELYRSALKVILRSVEELYRDLDLDYEYIFEHEKVLLDAVHILEALWNECGDGSFGKNWIKTFKDCAGHYDAIYR